MSVAFTEAWAVLKMGMPSMPSPPSDMGEKSPNGGGDEEYSHKDLDAEALIDFLVQTLGMDYQDAKVLVTHHKTKEMAGASKRKAKIAAESMVDEAPAPPQMGGY
jgi:uncharacterized protein (DUF2164 family)|tara:strand:+ start:247 stop:561 length:315 start_codon:yes stop_codon:yes gene_type:complete